MFSSCSIRLVDLIPAQTSPDNKQSNKFQFFFRLLPVVKHEKNEESDGGGGGGETASSGFALPPGLNEDIFGCLDKFSVFFRSTDEINGKPLKFY